MHLWMLLNEVEGESGGGTEGWEVGTLGDWQHVMQERGDQCRLFTALLLPCSASGGSIKNECTCCHFHSLLTV